MASNDLDIARSANMQPFGEIAEKVGIASGDFLPFGHYKAKLKGDFVKGLKDRPDGKLVLVTAISPTPAGEGKTTTSIG